MKKIILILSMIFINYNLSFPNPPNGFTNDPYPWHMEYFPPIDRYVPPYTPACSCACEDMVKSAEITSGQLDNELYLRGTAQEINVFKSEIQFKLIDVVEKYQIRVFNIYGNEVALLNKVKNQDIEINLNNLGLKNGLCLLQKLDYYNNVTLDKIFINY